MLYVTALTFGSAYKIYSNAVNDDTPTVVGDCTDQQDVDAWNTIKGPGTTMNVDMNDCAGLGTVDKCTTIFALDTVCVNKCMSRLWNFTPGCAPAFGNLT